MVPQTRYARSGKVNIAYQVTGEGPLDLVFIPGWVSHVELAWEDPERGAFLRRLASFSRLIIFDKRGTGLSDRVPDDQLPTLEERMDDLRAVMDAVGSRRAALFGYSEGGNMSVLFAATYPERTVALVTFSCFAKRIWSPDYPWAPTPEARAKEYETVEREWGNLMDLAHYIPSKMHDVEFARRQATFMRRSASPSAAVALLRMNTQIDVRAVLPAISAPTLVMHRTGDLDVNIEEGRWLATRIPGARFVEFAGDDHMPWIGNSDSILDEVQEFLTGMRPERDVDRVLATVLFTDIVGSTEHLARVGDKAWKDMLARQREIVRRALSAFRGREVDTAGDGFFATFDGPARGVRCAFSIQEAARPLGLAIRAGLHTGEVELDGERVGGMAVHIGARIAAQAGAGEALVSSTVKDLVSGSGLRFEDRGAHALKGVPGEWRLYAAS
ncbi:MAG: adenylate/guanylate cyclase domain-containing protein [Betaproteobacteria bacterium]|nr:adenylate/guanylate cyclase domain-containing protein [Betaproteobacteria bacterium]